jgi:plastocyanin
LGKNELVDFFLNVTSFSSKANPPSLLYKMRISFAAVTGLLLAAVPAVVRAQDPSQGQLVMVGQSGQLTFTPPSIVANVGTNVTFMFMSKNHSIAQSSFGDPCTPLPNGFAADFFPVSPDNTNFPTVTIAVTTNTPIWFFCPQTNPANHCKAGMVGAINPTPDKTFETFQAIAKGEQPPPAPAGGSSSVPGSTVPGAAPPSSPTSSVNGGGPVIPGPSSTGGPIIPGSTSTGAAPLIPGSGASTSAGAPATTSPTTSGALSQMRGASTAVVVGVVAVVASLL